MNWINFMICLVLWSWPIHAKTNVVSIIQKYNTKELMHCGTNNRAPRWTFTDPCKPEVRPGAREESESPAWLAAPALNARDTTKVHTWRPDTGCGPTLYRNCHSHNTPRKRHNNTWVEPLAGNCTTSSTSKWNKCDKNVKYKRTYALSLLHRQ